MGAVTFPDDDGAGVERRIIYILSVMARGKQGKSTRVNCDWTKAGEVTAPISIEELMEKEVQ